MSKIDALSSELKRKQVDDCVFNAVKAVSEVVSEKFIVKNINDLDLLFVGTDNQKDKLSAIWFGKIDGKFYYSVSV